MEQDLALIEKAIEHQKDVVNGAAESAEIAGVASIAVEYGNLIAVRDAALIAYRNACAAVEAARRTVIERLSGDGPYGAHERVGRMLDAIGR